MLSSIARKYKLDRMPSVLLVDDVPENLDILIENFQHDDIEISVALNGEDALKLVAAHKPDLVLLDVMMPGMSGYEVCKRLKSDPDTHHIPVIFITAMDQVDNEEYGLSLGAIDYVTKPFSVPILKARVRNHLELKFQAELLANLACLDGLTGIPNRRHFNEVLKREWGRCERGQRPLSVLMMDVDYFKRYNDTYGHGRGDRCLQQVTEAVRSVLNRPGDLLARYGGEEFVVILPETSANDALCIGKRICRAVEAQEITHKTSEVAGHVTLSVGCFTAIPDTELHVDVMIEEADKCLYQAKTAGRNQVISQENQF